MHVSASSGAVSGCVRLCLPALVLPSCDATGCCPCLQGVLLFGPPGTGKTLIARQIGKMLNGKDPKVVNGPEILNKWVATPG